VGIEPQKTQQTTNTKKKKKNIGAVPRYTQTKLTSQKRPGGVREIVGWSNPSSTKTTVGVLEGHGAVKKLLKHRMGGRRKKKNGQKAK